MNNLRKRSEMTKKMHRNVLYAANEANFYFIFFWLVIEFASYLHAHFVSHSFNTLHFGLWISWCWFILTFIVGTWYTFCRSMIKFTTKSLPRKERWSVLRLVVRLSADRGHVILSTPPPSQKDLSGTFWNFQSKRS